ncbi:TetR/AcrR family transcriptional regulator [Promicromonospora sp. Populi]|uniref:TetR/AcrR family transcriptional regulator n=1 Tax=Promicromonospora sp. Populi TaxID=3239420 RepID=UPI0034E1E814
MRPSSRNAILDAALRLAGHESGSIDITFEATAKEARVTKGGVQYHFHTRDELVLAVLERAAGRFHDAMLSLLDKPFDQTSPAERVRAYVLAIAAGCLSRADLAVYAEALTNPALAEPWEMLMTPWLNLDDVTDAGLRARLRAAHLAADGLWAADVTGIFSPTDDREALIAELLALTETPREVGR